MSVKFRSACRTCSCAISRNPSRMFATNTTTGEGCLAIMENAAAGPVIGMYSATSATAMRTIRCCWSLWAAFCSRYGHTSNSEASEYDGCDSERDCEKQEEARRVWIVLVERVHRCGLVSSSSVHCSGFRAAPVALLVSLCAVVSLTCGLSWDGQQRIAFLLFFVFLLRDVVFFGRLSHYHVSSGCRVACRCHAPPWLFLPLTGVRVMSVLECTKSTSTGVDRRARR